MSFRILNATHAYAVTDDGMEVLHRCDICHQSTVVTNSINAPEGWFLTGYCASQLCCGVCATSRTDVMMVTAGLFIGSHNTVGQKVVQGPNYRKATV